MMLANALRAHIAEFGVLDRQGIAGTAALMKIVEDASNDLLSQLARAALHLFVEQLRSLQEGIKEVEAHILAWHHRNEASRRLATTPGIGPIIASALSPSRHESANGIGTTERVR